MNNLKYTITKFDETLKFIDVTFDDGTWAQIRLAVPLPKNIDELEGVIRRFAAPVEAIKAQTEPDADLSYINPLIGSERTTARFSLGIQTATDEGLDPETEANLRMWEDVQFRRKVGDALVQFGIMSSNPADIPVSNA